MRMFVEVRIASEAGAQGLKSGALPQTIREFAAAAKPEAMYFTLNGGQRTMFAVIDLAAPGDMPRLLEPFLIRLNANVAISPCMNADDLSAGLQGLSLS